VYPNEVYERKSAALNLKALQIKEPPMNHYTHPEVLVDSQWLADRLDDPNLRVIEVDMNPDIYQDRHIPGAVFWNVFSDLFQPNLRINFDPTAISNLLSRSGITHDTTIVAYGSYPGTGAWIFWFLKMIGHSDVRVLNGGHQKWMEEGRPVTAAFSTVTPTQYLSKPLDNSMRVLSAEVQAAIANPDRVLVDVRTLAEYQGDVYLMKPPEETERSGHIPSAIHLEHILTLNDDGTFKSFDELQELFNSKSITPDKEVYPYCAVGGRSAYIWFVLKYLLGYPHVRNYDGSWNEWSRLPNVAIEK
jgi:thiosulfate/3-mercaptopyruvate sulfurtransferase